MAGNKQVNSDLEILGKAIVSTVPNNTGTVLTYNAVSKEISQRTNAQIISDLGLITATNIAAAYYTKTQLQTSGQAQVHWNNLTNVPTTFTPSVHNHDDRYYTETESDDRFVPYTGANKSIDFNTQQLTLNGKFEKKSNVFEISHLGNDGGSTAEHFKRLTDVASLTLPIDSTPGDIIITIPIRGNTKWVMEVDISNYGNPSEKLLISGYGAGNGSPQVSCLTDTEIISEVKFCRDANTNTVLILKRATGTSAFTYGKVNINDFYHAVTYHADLAVKSNYKLEFIDESTLTGITVSSIIKVDKVNFGTKNVDFTSGSISKTQNSIRHFRDVYHGYSAAANTNKILSIKFPPQITQSTMFRIEIDFYQYANNTGNYVGKLIVSFFKQSNTIINVSNGLSFHWIGDKVLPSNIVKVGFDSSGNISINIGDPTTDWVTYLGFRVSSVESKHTGGNNDYSKGWTHEFISDETGYTSLVTVPLIISANQDWVNTQITNAGHSHSNKAFLDTVVANTLVTNLNADLLDGQHGSYYAPNSSLGNYLPLTGGTMSNNAPINWNAGNALIQYGGVNRFRLSSSNTIISSVVTGTAQGIYLRPQGDSVNTGQVTINGNGQINTSSHGDSSQWKQAYDWGNFRDYGLGTNAVGSGNLDTITETGFYRTSASTIGSPEAVSMISVIHIEMSSTNATQTAYRSGSIKSWFRVRNNGVWGAWVELIHTDNLDSQATSLGFIKSSSIPTVNNGQLTLSTGTGLSGSATFTANQAGGSTFSVDVASTHKLPTTTEWSGKFNVPTGTTSQYVRGDGTLATFPTSLPPSAHTHTISDVTGLQAALDGKVDDSQVLTNVPAGAVFTDTVYTHPTTSGNKHIPAGGASGQILRWSADGTAVWGADNDTTYPVFTGTTTAGLVPARVGSTTTKYLREDGTWTVPPNTNTTYSAGTGLTLTSTTFSVNYGTASGTVAQGNDSRIINGQTAFGWGNFRDYGLGQGQATVGTWDLSQNYSGFVSAAGHGGAIGQSDGSRIWGFRTSYNSTAYGVELAMRGSRAAFQTRDNGTDSGWLEFWHSGNFNPANYASSTHTHTIAQVTGLQTALDGKVNRTGDTMTGALSVNPGTAQATHEFKIDNPGGRNDLYVRSDNANTQFRASVEDNGFFTLGIGTIGISNVTGFDFLQIPASNAQFRVGFFANDHPTYMSAISGSGYFGGEVYSVGYSKSVSGFVHGGIGGNSPNQILKSNGGMTGISLWDVIEEDGSLIVKPFIDYLIYFNGGDIRNAVVYLINKEDDDFYIDELRKGQRLHLINQNMSAVSVIIDSQSTLFSIPSNYKATLIKSENNEYFLYDVTPYQMYTP